MLRVLDGIFWGIFVRSRVRERESGRWREERFDSAGGLVLSSANGHHHPATFPSFPPLELRIFRWTETWNGRLLLGEEWIGFEKDHWRKLSSPFKRSAFSSSVSSSALRVFNVSLSDPLFFLFSGPEGHRFSSRWSSRLRIQVRVPPGTEKPADESAQRRWRSWNLG